MRIGELSERSGASARSIRYYESVGLLTSRRRTNGYREFDADALEQITKIKLLLQVGLDIVDIVTVLPCVDKPSVPHCAQARQRFDEQIERIERQQQLLARAKSLLVELRTEGTAAAALPPGDSVRAVSANVTVGVR
ncbi:MerR family transcriptional regulator [Streptomyces sp. NPDC002766]|jgi:DNA-binding transcriptional MerR regulator|uniref:MerR family transcriptional regulator n=1 Tax=unclassified Streptomyces TaxID=2593676 RepID=UPI003330954F